MQISFIETFKEKKTFYHLHLIYYNCDIWSTFYEIVDHTSQMAKSHAI